MLLNTSGYHCRIGEHRALNQSDDQWMKKQNPVYSAKHMHVFNTEKTKRKQLRALLSL